MSDEHDTETAENDSESENRPPDALQGNNSGDDGRHAEDQQEVDSQKDRTVPDETGGEPVAGDERIDEPSEAVSSLPDETVTTDPGELGDTQFVPAKDTGSTPVSPDEAFDDLAVEEVEADEIWAEVTEEERQALASKEAEDEPSEEERDLSRTDEVSKHDYCERCEYFSEAPEIRCSHEGTEILEFVDMDQVRVSNCPIVAEREGLEEGVSQGSTELGNIQRD